MRKLFLLTAWLLFMAACAKQPAPVTEPSPATEKEPAAVEMQLTADEQQEKALHIFDEILNITQNTTKKRAFAEIEARYTAIIDNYPDAKIARESYIRLLRMYITNKSAENISKAEKLLKRFVDVYPNDPMEDNIRAKINEVK